MEFVRVRPHISGSLDERNRSNAAANPLGRTGQDVVENDSNQNDEREMIQLRKKLITETGFASYADFLGHLKSHSLCPTSMIQKFVSHTGSHSPVSFEVRRASALGLEIRPLYTILDVSSYEHAPPISVRGTGLSATQALIAVRSPPKNVSVQIILLDVNNNIHLSPDFEDVFSLGLQLYPEFTGAVRELNRSTESPDHQIRHKQTSATFIQVMGILVTISQRYKAAQSNAPPVIFIAGDFKWVDARWSTLYHQYEFYNYLRRSQPNATPLEEKIDVKAFKSFRSYIQILEHFVKLQLDHDDDKSSLLIGCLLPLLQLESLFFRVRLCQFSTYFYRCKTRATGDSMAEGSLSEMAHDRNAPARLYKIRIIIRTRVEVLEDQDTYVSWFMSGQVGADLSENLLFIRYQEDRKHVIAEAHRLEAEIRDYLQIQASLSALLESRKSIELSNYQIQEGKRGMLPYILAEACSNVKQSRSVRACLPHIGDPLTTISHNPCLCVCTVEPCHFYLWNESTAAEPKWQELTRFCAYGSYCSTCYWRIMVSHRRI